MVLLASDSEQGEMVLGPAAEKAQYWLLHSDSNDSYILARGVCAFKN